MFGAWIGKARVEPSTAARSTSPRMTPEGVRYAAPGGLAADWLADPYAAPDTAYLASTLAQLQLEGLGECQLGEYLLPWSALYELLRRPELQELQQGLNIPPQSTARPRLTSKGAIGDEDFAILLAEWVDPYGRPLQPTPKLVGRALLADGSATLVSDDVHRLLSELEHFHGTPAVDRTKEWKERSYARMRSLATSIGCPVSDYVARTIVLTPERLNLGLQQRGEGDTRVVEAIPSFVDAPDQWLPLFDRLPLQDSYDVPDGPSLVRVVLSPAVKTVLAEIKRMPGRLVVGPRAEAFVRNPFALLGESAHEVIDAEEFQGKAAAAGVRFHRFTPKADQSEAGQILGVALLIEAMSDAATDDADVATSWFDSPADLERFTGKLGRCLADGSQSVAWQGRDLEILGETATDLQTLESWLHAWRQPALWTAAEVLDLSNYSERIEGIGIEKPFVVPVIARQDEGKGWFEDNVAVGVKIQSSEDESSVTAAIPFGDIPSLQQAVQRAEQAGQTHVSLPGVPAVVPLADARSAVDALVRARAALAGGGFTPPPPRISEERKRLVIKRNLEDVDYSEVRTDSLQMPQDRQPRLPQGLKPEIVLKAHQHTGVAWLQHLWDASPDNCRGTVLADDMGLGKTLQLLTFMASCFERDPSLPPALVVAPVALLENWRNELSRFFEPGTLPLLMLYGDALRSLRVGKHELDAELRGQGVTRLLKKNWVGDAKLVLTTYETMRDLEFAMASQPWSIMVCDEAQKIKNPAAMVTRSAKKQKVRFRIACTGTPVENTLADLWCLFDFVQPGMLGALNHFSRTYRQPIEVKTNEQQQKVEELRALIRPQILHRRKTDVAKDLPPLLEDADCKQLPMSAYQQRLYEGALASLREQRATNPSAQLQALHAIRKICSDPHGHAEQDGASIPIERLVNESPKLGWLVRHLRRLAADTDGNHKVIVFCEFRQLQLQLQRVIAAFFGFAPSIVNGDTSADPRVGENRQQLIDAFQAKEGFGVIILSPLAVGFGVNIQAANHVVHFTRTWNPAKEDQATARAYRIGQQRTVTVHYPGVVSDRFPSFDVKLDALLGSKRALAHDMLNGCSDLKASDFADFG
ncbi:DEAD/DEAH box helicase [Cupriavidus respiraculi]|nr:DEAD/DEAH box helicase [Cupriavidus respiraculi]